jgi:lysozyme
MHQWESCRLTAYPDPGSADGNPWTIGWGTTIIEGKPVVRGMRITQEQADDLFEQDLVRFEREVLRLTQGVELTQGQFDALVSFVYNVGPAAFAGSTLRRMILAKDFAAAQLQFTRWNRNDGKVMRGLTRRRFGEAVVFGPRTAEELRPLLPSGVLLHLV